MNVEPPPHSAFPGPVHIARFVADVMSRAACATQEPLPIPPRFRLEARIQRARAGLEPRADLAAARLRSR